MLTIMEADEHEHVDKKKSASNQEMCSCVAETGGACQLTLSSLATLNSWYICIQTYTMVDMQTNR